MDTLRLQDRHEITECLYRYIRGVDRKNWDLVRSAFHPDAHDDHGNYTGGPEGFIAQCKARHETIEQSMHIVGNMWIEFDGPDGALVETYFITHQRIGPAAGDARLAYLRGKPIAVDQAVETEVIGRYVDRLTRREGAWKIQDRTVVYEVFRGQPAPSGGGLRGNWVTGQRDGTDRIEVLQKELGLG